MAYRQAWYKINTPLAYYASYFTIRADEFNAELMTRGDEAARSAMDDLYKMGHELTQKDKNLLTILELVVEMYARGIVFLPVDIYASDDRKFLIESGGLRPPLTALPGLGGAAALGIVAARASGEFISVDDFAFRSKASKTVIEILRGYGCLEGMDESSQLSFF
jgi:DNA polymerase-3 subunit alpha (Gram-positive type)